MKKWLPLIALCNVSAYASTASLSVSNLVITEYIEGSSNNKALEISNMGTSPVHMKAGGYKLSLYSNGGTTPSQELELEGTLPAGASFVVYNASATDAFKKAAPAGIDSAVTYFNGDDAIVLSNSAGVVDRFGKVGERTIWSNANGFSAKDKTVRRLASVTQGDTTADGDFTTLMDQYQVFDQDTADGLGCPGVAACTGSEPKPTEENAAAPAKVLITEYVEGGSYNKAIEISNIGGSNIDLASAGYKLQLFANGATEMSAEAPLSGILVPDSSIVVFNVNATDDFKKAAPQGIEASNVINFNGDDAIVLVDTNGIVDSFAQVGVRQEWTNTDGFGTKDKTLRRKSSITEGNTVADDDFTSQMAEWVAFAKDTADGLGCHGEAACTGSEPLPLAGEGSGGDNGGDNGGDTGTEICTNCPPLDKIKDRANFADATYYANALAAQDGDKATFVAALNQDIAKDHKQLTYAEVWTALTYTDEDPANDKNVILLYTGRSMAKAENGSGTNANNQDAWNREHVWAKSHGFPETNQFGYTDIHHLRPADVSMNTQRSDNDFDNGGDPVAESPENIKNGGISWEPRNQVKGDVARMMFYMDVRYEANGGGNMADLRLVDRVDTARTGLADGYGEMGKLCTLYQWHLDDPVSDFEVSRNHTVFEFQGNRNPFIDHPEWVEKIYKAQCDTSLPELAVTIEAVSSAKANDQVALKAVSTNDAISYAWTQVSGTQVTIENATTANASFVAPAVNANENLVFKVTISRENGDTASAEVTIALEAKTELQVTISGSQDVIEANSVTITAAANMDATFAWTQTAGPAGTLQNADAAAVTFAAPEVDQDTQVTLSVTITTADNQTRTEEVSFTVLNVVAEENDNSGSMHWLLLLLPMLVIKRRKSA